MCGCKIIEGIKDADIKSKLCSVKSLIDLKINDNAELKQIYDEIKNTEEELYEHSVSVAEISCLLGILYNFRLDELLNLYLGALYHDNGKTMLNQNILYKPAKFSPDEKQLIEAHTSIGYKRMKMIISDKITLDIILKHHERINNTGYPNGLGEPEQSIFVRIVAVADVFQALISKRCYKEPMSMKEAINILSKDKGLDQMVVTILKQAIIEK